MLRAVRDLHRVAVVVITQRALLFHLLTNDTARLPSAFQEVSGIITGSCGWKRVKVQREVRCVISLTWKLLTCCFFFFTQKHDLMIYYGFVEIITHTD